MNDIRESELSIAFEAAIKPGRAGVVGFPRFSMIVRELVCQQGRPDFVTSPMGAGRIRKTERVELAAALKSPAAARVLSVLKRTPRSEEFICRVSAVSIRLVRRSLRELMEHRLIERSGGSGYVTARSLRSQELELWAFEIKVANWRRALYQALQYRAFAHNVAVVIAEQWAHRVEKHVDYFDAMRVGLFALSGRDCKLRLIHPPERREPASRFHYLYALGSFLTSA